MKIYALKSAVKFVMERLLITYYVKTLRLYKEKLHVVIGTEVIFLSKMLT